MQRTHLRKVVFISSSAGMFDITAEKLKLNLSKCVSVTVVACFNILSFEELCS